MTATQKAKKSQYLSLKDACQMLDISEATGRNWMKLGKIKAIPDAKGITFYRKDIEHFLASLRNGDDPSLKSRRNKTALKGRELYVNYVSRESPNHSVVSMLVNNFSGTSTAICALLCEAFLRLIVSGNKLSNPHSIKGSLLKAYLEGKLDVSNLEWLLLELMDKTPINSLKRAANLLPDINLCYVPYEDTLGLIYLSLMEFSKRRQSGRYYTPQNLTDTAVETLQVARGRVFLDPCCGSGNFLLRLLKRGARVEDLYGSDLDGFSVTLARVNFVLSGNCTDKEILCSHLVKCDTITSKNFPNVDVVLGNPPWGSCEDPIAIRKYSKILECANKNRPCFADLFVERSLNQVQEGGIVQFVLPEALLNVGSHEPLRQYIAKHARVRAVRYLGEVFHAVQCPSVILTLEKTSFAGATGDVIVNTNDTNYVVRRNREPLDFNFKITDQEATVIEKMDDLEHCVKLKGYAKFALGIVTGSNKGSIFKEQVPGSEPILRGEDVKPFTISKPTSFIRYEDNKFQQVAPMEMYRSPVKLVYKFISRYPIVAVDKKGLLTLNSANFIVPTFKNLSPVYLAAVLNSSAVRFYFEKKFQSLKVLKSLLEEVPIPFASINDQMQIEFLVEELKEAEDKKKSEIFKKIDEKIAEIYGLAKRSLNLIKQSV